MKVLVLGGSGMLGHKLAQILSSRFDVFAAVRDANAASYGLPIPDPNRMFFGISAGNLESVAYAINTIRPHAVINCIGIIKQLDLAKDPIPSIWINALFPHRLATLCRKAGIRLIHVSTDCVFSGRRGMYTESDISDAEDLYGRTKLLGEVGAPGCLTLRTSIIGRELRGYHGLVEWFLAQAGGRVSGYRKAVFSGFTTAALAAIVGEIIEDYGELEGLWHVASLPIAKYDLLQLIREAYDLDVEILPEDKTVCDRSLDGSRFESVTGISSPDWDSMIESMAKDPTPYEEIRRLHACR